jgi:predicted nucleic acid-binding protein
VASAFCDTTVLVAASDASHPHHAPCITLLGSLRRGTAFCALHSYAELYAVLSGMPGRPRLRPSDVESMIARLDRVFTPVALTRREYRAAIGRSAEQGVTGGRLYDALILACGIKSRAAAIYTLNERDFVGLASPDVAPRIRRP